MIVSEIMGGLGNQMFQYACGRAVAEKNHTLLELDVSWFFDKSRQYGLGKFNIQEHICHNPNILKLKDGGRLCRIKNLLLNNFKSVPEKKIKHDGYKFPKSGDLYLRGYWQSEKYFSKIADEIRHDLVLKVPLSENSACWKKEILEKKNTVSVHIRRGDYITSEVNREIYRVIPLEYYYQCISMLEEKYGDITVFVFSNDIPWVKENLKLDLPVHYVEGNDEDHGYEDMHLMSLCQHNIIANSTFSWWGAWLNRYEGKTVCSPLRWFNIDSYENEYLLPDEWIKY